MLNTPSDAGSEKVPSSDSSTSTNPFGGWSGVKLSSSESEGEASHMDTAILMRASVVDDKQATVIDMVPAKLSFFSSQCYVMQDDATLATIKTQSTGYKKAAVVMAPVLGTLLGAKWESKAEVENPRRQIALQEGRTEKISETVKDAFGKLKEIALNNLSNEILCKFQKNILTPKVLFGFTVGTVAGITLNARKPHFFYENSNKNVRIKARWKESRGGFLIEYTPVQDLPDVKQQFLLKLNPEKDIWELFSEKKVMGDAALVAAEMKDDVSVPVLDKPKLEQLAAGTGSPDVEEGGATIAEVSPTVKSDDSEIDLTAMVQETPPQPILDVGEIGVQEDPTRADAVMSEEEVVGPLMSLPGTLKSNQTFSTTDGLSIVKVERFKRYKLSIVDTTISIPFIGAQEKFSFKFEEGTNVVPRDVVIFSTYIVRTTNLVPLDMLLIWLLLAGLGWVVASFLLWIGTGLKGVWKNEREFKTLKFDGLCSRLETRVNPKQIGESFSEFQ